MKKNKIVGLALAIGVLSVGAASASAAISCCSEGKCADKQIVQNFTEETVKLTSALQAKDLELRNQYSNEGSEYNRVDVLEAEIAGLKGKIKLAAEKYGIPSCCRI